MYCLPAILFALISIIYMVQAPVACQNDEDDPLRIFNDTREDQDSYPIDEGGENSRCQIMDIPFCENLDYNRTMLPNLLGHHQQQDVINEINIYHPLLQVNCSPDLKLFLCTVYAPICFDQFELGTKPVHLFPCRSLCESARNGCHKALRQLNAVWPPALHCDKFPDARRNKSIICVGKEHQSWSMDPISVISGKESIGSVITRDLGFVCPKNFEVPSYSVHLNGKTYHNCAMPCEDVLFNKKNTHIIRLTTGVAALVCFISTAFTCITFLADTKRFKYPARPIIIISFCQLVVATCFLVGCMTNNQISCNEPVDPPPSLPNMKMIRTATMGNKKGSCTLQFMALYFFQMSTLFWWLMMTISWYMIAKLKWAPEAVSSVARYFHLISWTVPALLTIYLSVLGNIEGDSLTGTCYVSVSNQESTRVFVVYPMLFCLIAGCFFLVSGFKSLWDSRETLRSEYGKQTDEHQKLVMRIGVFSILFLTFSTILLCCHLYEQSNLNSWMLSWLSDICRNRDYSIPCPVRNPSNNVPQNHTFMLKYLATLSTGIISALFMLSEKTLSTYREVAELCNYRM